jgi:alanine racemase
MINKLKQLFKPKYCTLNILEIKKQAILDNYQLLQDNQPQAAIFPVLKSNAYGHGLKEICTILNDSAAPLVVVDSFPEAQIALRYFKKKILVLGEMPAKVYSYCDFKRSEFCIYNRESLEALANLGRAKVHLFINSGMNREGIKDIKKFLEDNKDLLSKVEVSGFCSHLAASEVNDGTTEKQLEKFLSDLEILKAAGYDPRWVHLGNSAAIFSLHNEKLTAFRSGLSLYGYNPFDKENTNFNKAESLKPALRLSSTVVSLQDIDAGDKVSYNGAYQADSKEKVAVIPFGYYEGLDRGLSNSASLVWEEAGKRHYLKIAGKVCMNLCCLEINDLNVKIGDRIEIVSLNKEDLNSLENLAKISGRITYELLVGFQANIRKIIV